MARRGALVLASAACVLLASSTLAASYPQAGNGDVLGHIRSQLAQDHQDLAQQLEPSSTRRLLQSDATVPITASHSVVLPSVSDLPTVMAALAEMASGSSTGMFPANLFPGMNATRYGFSPTEDSFCMFHVPKTGGKTPQMPASGSGAYGYGSHSGTYGGGYGGYIPGSYSAYGTNYDVVDLTGPTPNPTFPYGLPGPLAQLVQMLGAELDCLLAPVLPGSAPNFAVFIEVMLEDGFALFGQFIKWMEAGVLSGNVAANTEEIIYLRDPVNPWGPPLKLEFSLGSLSAAFGSNIVIPASPSTESYYSPTPYYSPTTPDNTMSPVAAYFAEGSTQPGVAYDGYLDQCAVVLGSAPGSDGAFDQVNDFSASINEGAWSVPLSTLINETSDVAYIVPAAKTNDYAQLTMADRKSAGFCYDIATLLPLYNPMAVPIPDYVDPNTTSLSASPLSTVLVFGQPFGLNQPSLKTAFGISQDVDIITLDALDETQKDPESEGAMVYKQAIIVQNTVTMVSNLLTNDSSNYASFAVLVDQAIGRAALSATVQAAANGFNETGPALDLTNPQVVQDIIYGARAWVSTTSDQSLPSSMSNVDARTIYATAYATANIAAATAVAANASEIEKTSYFTQAMVAPQLEDMVDGSTSVDKFMLDNSPEAISEGLASTQLPGMLDVASTLGQQQTGSTATQAASSKGDGGLSGGQIAGITIGSVAGAALLAGVAGLAFRSRQRRSAASRV